MKLTDYICFVFFMFGANILVAQTQNNSVNTTQDTTVVACNYFEWMGTYYTASGDYSSQTKMANGNTSEKTLHLTILQPSVSVDVQEHTDTYTWINGVTYTSSNNTAMYFIQNGSKNGCDSIVTLNLTISNTTANFVSQSIIVEAYPNPVKGVLQIVHNIVGATDISLLDINGKIVYQNMSISKTQQIDVSNLAKGIYFLKFQNDQITRTLKIVKQ